MFSTTSTALTNHQRQHRRRLEIATAIGRGPACGGKIWISAGLLAFGQVRGLAEQATEPYSRNTVRKPAQAVTKKLAKPPGETSRISGSAGMLGRLSAEVLLDIGAQRQYGLI